ncbi:DUF2849 domain-containing protein [Thalassobaculum sp. OXR-137]|uniref:DUF2849 domain-containing protein n=1 Tax=Thalassobaculum sp. OXR-137 TaxID=3100173 RepID=UPI002AC8D08E|nr:DUF2849 domain-containing protein [Thalassobaculum sp. OXR-137]WPZ35984.1 DUF2849 domain-containing protein [Thalassobaculum sp. OXR-137]
MSDTRVSKVMTANRLSDGAVVYLTLSHTWSDRFADAHASDVPSELAGFEATTLEAVRGRIVVGAYLFAVSVGSDGSLEPLGQRERIRSAGPTVGTDLPASVEVA